MTTIREAVSAPGRYLAEHPAEARYRDSPALARIDSGLAVSVTGRDGASLLTDMPPGIGGGGTAPSPGWVFRAAVASCVASLVAIRTAVLEIEVTSVEVEVDSESDDRGILGLDETVPAGPYSMRVAVAIDAPGHPTAELDAVARWAVDHCPVSDAVKRPVPVELELRVSVADH